MTKETIKRLIAAGLTKQQATSATAEMLTKLYMSEDSSLLVDEARQQVKEMQNIVGSLQLEYMNLVSKISHVSDTILGIEKAQKEYGEVRDERARNAIALYGALISMNEKAGCTGETSVTNAGYIMYAYLGGQAKQEIEPEK